MSSASPCDLRVLVIEDSDASFTTFRTLLNRIARQRAAYRAE
jgi:hypothetical protein